MCVRVCNTLQLCIVTQFLIFVPLLTYDQRRIVSKRNFVICCIKHEDAELQSKTENAIEINKVKSYTVTRSPSASAPSPDGTETLETTTDAPEATATTEATESVEVTFTTGWRHKLTAEYFLTWTVVPLLANRIFRVVMIVLFAGMLALSIVSLQWLNTETDLGSFVPDDSFVLDYLDALNDGFGTVSSFSTLFLVVENRDFSEAQTRAEVWDMIASFEAPFESDYATTIGDVTEWMGDFEDWINQTYGVSVGAVAQDGNYYEYLQLFTNTSGREWADDIVLDDEENPSKIEATRFEVLTRFTQKTKERWQSYPLMKKEFNNAMGDKKSGFVYNWLLLFAYLAEAIVGLTVNNLIFTGVGVFCALLFLMDLRMSLFIVLTIAMIDIGMFLICAGSVWCGFFFVTVRWFWYT